MQLVWGVSRLRDFKICPEMFLAKYVTKNWVDTEGPAIIRGKKIHKEIEDTLKYDLQINQACEWASVIPYVQGLLQMKYKGAAVLPEYKFGLDVRMQPVEFFKGPDLRARIMEDVYVNRSGRVLNIDWKTGRYKPEHRGDGMFYAAANALAAEAPDSETQYIYIDEPQNSFSVKVEDPVGTMQQYYRQFEAAEEILDGGKVPEFVVEADGLKIPGSQCRYCGNLACGYNKNTNAKR